MIRIVLVILLVVTGLSVASAEASLVKQRKALMKLNGQHYKIIARMARGEEAFDQAKVIAAFAVFNETARRSGMMFPEPPKQGEDTRAALKIWEAKSDFDAKMLIFAKVVEDYTGKLKTVEELKLAVPKLVTTCSECHEHYRRSGASAQKDKDGE